MLVGVLGGCAATDAAIVSAALQASVTVWPILARAHGRACAPCTLVRLHSKEACAVDGNLLVLSGFVLAGVVAFTSGTLLAEGMMSLWLLWASGGACH